MGSITTLRPSSTSSGVGWTPSAGTLHGVTSDDSDATFATWSGDGSPMILATPVDSPPAGERRHQVRLRARGEDGDAWWAVRLASGSLVAGAAAQFASSPETVIGSWGFGAPADGSTVLYTYVTGQSTGVRITELYVDVDCREEPTFTPEILDGSGSPSVTISDTTQPTIRAASIDLDDLNARQYRYWVTLRGAIVWDTGITSGAAVNRQTVPLDNGAYVAHLQVWSTLGENTSYPSDEETLAFTVTVGSIFQPVNPTVVPVDGTPFYSVEACAPNVDGLDGEVGYIEVQRVDCPVGGYLVLPGSPGAYASTPDPGQAVPVNVPSGDFETSVNGWAPTGGSLTHSTAQAHGGTGSALLVVVGAPPQTYMRPDGIANSTIVTPGRIYRTTFWLYAPVAIASVTVAIDWFDAGVSYLSGEYDTSSIGAGAWTQFEIEGMAPVGAFYANYGPTIIDVNGTQVYVDQVTFEDITPPVDLEIVITAGRDDDWRPAGNDTLIAHYDSGSNQRSWRLNVDAIGDNDPALVGRPLLSWSTDGTSSLTFAGATERLPVDPFGVARLRVLLDTDDGAGGWTVTFETRETDESDWTQLGEVVTNSGGGTTSLFDTDVDYTVGAWFASGVPNELFTGRIYSAQVRDGAAGAIIVNPDFTNHLDGTRTFEDGVGNTWSINNSASIYSPVSVTSVAILGPLETDECAEYVDFTMPRQGMGATCDHLPVQCCSYYRARTIGREDGDLRISAWSDFFDPAIPAGLIVMWPDTAASLPTGWERVTALDGLYPKGVTNTATDPGITGGAATHTHSTPGHVHDTSHTHGHSTNTGAASGTVNSTPNAAGTANALSSHTHTRPTTGSASVNSGSASPLASSVANDPARLEVIFAASDGTPLGVPDGGLGLMPDIAPAGWTDYANGANRFFKGAAAAGNGGATAASAVDSHTHTVDAHTHTGTAHVHTSANTGAFNSANSLTATGQQALSATSHTHPLTINSASSQALASASGGASGAAAADSRPPFRNVRVRENTSGAPDLPVGLICAWRGVLDSIPPNWHLCDGTDGTMDLLGVYPQGATSSIGTAGGSGAAHSHTGGSHTHTTTGHAHTETVGAATTTSAAVSTTNTVNVVTAAHLHSATDTNSATPTVVAAGSGTSSSFGSEPPFEQVAFVQLITEPTPPEDPDTFCLSWSDDEHLVRSTGPSGPLWAPILGKFEWDVERPFTAAAGLMGSRFVTSAPPGGRNLSMTAAVENEADLATLREVLARPLVLISPSDATEVWAAPIQESVKIIKVGRIRQITAEFIGTGPQPPPQIADVGV